MTPAIEETRSRVRVADGAIFDGILPPERQRSIHLGMLHQHTQGFVEIAAGPRPPGGKVRIHTRTRPDHYLPGGATGNPGWLPGLLELVDRHDQAGDEVFVGVAVRSDRGGAKDYVTHTHWLWVDVDSPDGLPALWAFLERKPAHLVVMTGGSGGAHAYWRLNRPLEAKHSDPATGEPIERAHIRLVHAIGVDDRGKPNVADLQCKDRSRVLRVAGTRNFKTGRHAEILWADMALGGWPVQALIGDLPDPHPPRPARAPLATGGPKLIGFSDDAYKRIAAIDYFARLARIEVPRAGALVSCISAHHQDRNPSCRVSGDTVWTCFGCGVGGGIYDAASAVLGGPTGRDLKGNDFKRAVDFVKQTYGELT